MANCKCEDKDTNGYYNLKCIKGNCPTEGDNSTPTLHLSVQDMVGTVSYYQYELLTSTYTVKRGVDAGKEKETMRTERVSYSVAIQDAIFKLDSLKTKYLLHRYLIADDKMHWPSVMATVCEEKPIFHMDFSENIQLTPKMEVQDAHFNKRQFSLHCSVKHGLTAKGNEYFYHLSDETKHDVTFVKLVVQDLIASYPSIKILRFKSDN